MAYEFSNSNESDNENSQKTSSESSSPLLDLTINKLFVGGLSWQTTSEKLREYFEQFGTVTDVLIMKDPITQRSRGFGFITFTESRAVDSVLNTSGHILDGKKIDPKHATPKSKKSISRTKKIFVGGLSQETTMDEVKKYFEQFGQVEEAVLLMDQQTKRHRGFGFVTFMNEDNVDRVCSMHFHVINKKKVECKKALPKDQVQQQTSSLINKRMSFLANYGQVQLQAQLALAAQAAQLQITSPHSISPTLYPAAIPGKLLPTYANYRYSPYPLPAATLAALPYSSYALASVDMSSFQGIDLSGLSMYGMYVP